MKTVAALALLVLSALAVPNASAQAPEGITVTPTDLASPIPYEGSAQLAVSVSVGCLTILQNTGSTTVEVAVTDAPAWLTATPASVEVDETTCITGGNGFATGAGAIGLAVTKDAPGVVDHSISLAGTLGSASSEAVQAVFTVAYHVNYTVVSDATFPMTVNGTEASFNVTITQASNARSMVMIEELQTSAGVFSGLGSQQYENEAGKPDSRTFKVTFKAPTGEWTNATAQFTAYGHYLLLNGQAGDFDAGTPVTYSFVAGQGASDGEDEGKDSPAPAGVLLALGLVALAAFARRRE
jgi:MYXO-CTERM domain-containing protein